MDELEKPESRQGTQNEPAAEAGKSARKRFAFELPEGSLGVLLLLVVAALSGGLIAAYWPAFFGGDVGVAQERLAALETRVGQIAAGRAGAAASGIFDELRREVAALAQRLDADEARLTGLEKSSGEPGQPGSAELAPMREKLDATTSAIADLGTRMAKLESATQGVSASELSGINTKVTALDARLAALEADLSRSTKALEGTVTTLETRLKSLEGNAPPADLALRLESFVTKNAQAGIEERVKALEAQNSGESLHRAATMLALARLARAAGEPGPFTLEVETFAAAAPGDPAIALVQSYAASGVPTRADLRLRFASFTRAALDAERSADARGFWARLWANIRSLVSVRRVGEAAGNDPQSKLARAQVRLDAGDLVAAANEVRALTGPAAKTMSPWLKDAEARLALDRAIAQMSARVVQSLAATSQAPASTSPESDVAPPAPAPLPPQEGAP